MNTADVGVDAKQKAQVKILEQPASKALRFRYECEGRSAGSLPGANSTTENKTYPTIQVLGYRGKAVVVVSCVTKDFPYKPHPHSLVGKEGCKKGVCTLEINNDNMICTFSNLGVQCVKKKGIEEALKLREEIRVDPFHTGFAHKNQPQSIDLNAVRLCFQVFLEGQKGKFSLALKPVVSEAIYDKKAMCELTICKLSDCTSPVNGGKEIILLCDKVTKDDIQVVFYHEEEGHLIWEGTGEFSASDVHKQVAITFRTPRYRVTDVEEPISVYVQLRRPSDGACSESRRFEYLPMDSGSVDAVVPPFDNSALFASKRFKPDFPLYTHILALDAAVLARQMFRAPEESRQYSDAFVQCSLLQEGETTSEEKQVEIQRKCDDEAAVEKPLENLVDLAAEKLQEKQIESRLGLNDTPPPLPEKGVGFAKLKSNLIKSGESLDFSKQKSQKNPVKTVNFDRSSLSTIVSEFDSDGRLSVASSEDLNSRLSAAFSDYSDLTDVRSIAEESEVDINDSLSLISSTHTLNDRLSQVSDASDISIVSDQTVIHDSKSDTGSIDTIEQQLEMLESMSVDPDCQTYSSFQMAMKHPIFGWPSRTQPTDTPVEAIFNDLVYDDPTDDPILKLEVPLPAVPPRVESKTVSTPPLPPRRFKKLNQPLPDPPTRDLGLKSALQALKQTFKKAKPMSKSEASLNSSVSIHSSQRSIYNSQESVRDAHQNASAMDEQTSQSEPDTVKSDNETSSEQKLNESPVIQTALPTVVVDQVDPDNLTEAENYALYMRLAPLATASEFDENETLSMLYGELTPNRDAVSMQDGK
ncbi:embryonic polarity protein dorsal-like isoform X2 [Daphnia pulicaria]|nr:embryonic polarity protein dorsal-like isoform X2 [Daphnia pulicaria]